jgi:hypothetical protein
MTQSPYGGPASPNFPQNPDFGATTMSGTATEQRGGASGSSTETQPHEADTGFRAPQGSPGSPGSPNGPGQPGQQPGQGGQPGQPGQGGPPGQRPGSAPNARAQRTRGPRRARLQLRHISPLTVLKFSCVLAIALFFVWLIVVGILYGVLDAAGVVERINSAYTNLNGPGTKDPITAGVVFGGAAIIGVANIILFVALTTIGSVIYNLCADLVGGIEITLSER